MDLLSISRLNLISEIYESKKMIFRIINLPEETQSLVATSFTPYLSMICEGIDSLFKDNERKSSEIFGDINGKSFTYLIGKTRASSKLLTDKKISKALAIIDKEIERFNMTLRNGYSEKELTYVIENGQPDLGVYYYKNKPFANTSQLLIYQGEFLEIFDSVDSLEKVGPLIQEFNMNLTQYINGILSELKENQLDIIQRENCIIELEELDFKTKDYIFSEEKHRNIFNNGIDKRISLYLFNVMCQLNFSIMLLNKLIDSHSLRYRIEFLIYYYSVQAIKYVYTRESGNLDNSLKKEMTNIIEFQNILFSSNTLRNNLFHYRFSEDNLDMEVKNDYFINMVEFQTKRNFEEVMLEIRNAMEKITELIESIIY